MGDNNHDVVDITTIIVEDRFRKEMGDIQGMVDSIKEHGVIQPLVLSASWADGTISEPKLVVGGRRLAALKQMGLQKLEHAKHFVWRGETTAKTPTGLLRLRSMELEENIRRKDMTWDEEVTAKAELLRLMEQIHGKQGSGLSIAERNAGTSSGFGVRKLSAMLGESLGKTSQDLQLAQMVKVMPSLKTAENKSAALRVGMLQLVVGVIKGKEAAKVVAAKEASEAHAAAVAQAVATGKPIPIETPPIKLTKPYEVWEGDLRVHISSVPSGSVDLVFTDLPYGVHIDENSMGGLTFKDSREAVLALLPDVANQSYRILREGRYAAFWFGFWFYGELKNALERSGFTVDPVPLVWNKHRNYSPNPLCWYNLSYEQCLIARKGDARMVRPGQSNIIDIPNVSPSEKVQVAQKPVELCQKIIEDLTMPLSTVVDMFAGSGSTGVAALRTGRKALLFEIDPVQCSLIRNRMEGWKP